VVTRQSGITLIELMIVVAIIGLLAVVTTPFTQGWIDEARVNDARSLLHRGYAEAKALALRNPENAQGNQVAACLLLSDGVLLVRESQPSGAACNGDTVWQGDWPSGVDLIDESDEREITEIHINNRGQPLNSSNSPTHSGIIYRLERGSVKDENPDYNRLR